MAFPKIGPTIPGLGVDYTSPAVSTSRQNAINIRSTGATAGEANRFAQMAPKGTRTKPAEPISISQAIRNTGATPGEANRFAALAPSGTTVTSSGRIVAPPPSLPPMQEQSQEVPAENVPDLTGNGADGDTGGGFDGDTGGGITDPVVTEETPAAVPETAEEAGMTDEEYQQLLASTINDLLRPGFIDFQGTQASELRRLQNLYNQLYGTEEGMIGSLQRQQQIDAQARRRLAAQRAMAGMLQGGAYAGGQRGLGTIQQAQQAYGLQEMQRPFREQTQADRLYEFGLSFDPEATAAANRFNMIDFGDPDNIMGGWASAGGTFAGRSAYETARQQAIRDLLSRGISI